MCGIGGFAGKSFDYRQARLKIESIEPYIVNRGPDHLSRDLFDGSRVGLIHARLAVQSNLEFGSQPMRSKCGRFALVYNGEIYNFDQLRRANLLDLSNLSDHVSDTALLLQLFVQFGVSKSLQLVEGPFALAFIDFKSKVVELARDSFGEKPLYYQTANDCIEFCSDLRGLLALRSNLPKIDNSALELFWALGYCPPNLSICEGVNKLGPGELIKFDYAQGLLLESESWDWSLKSAHFLKNFTFPDPVYCKDAVESVFVEKLEQVVSTSGQGSLGLFLSGGVDSALIASKLPSRKKGRVVALTVAVNHAGFSEAERAEKIAKHCGLDHCTLDFNFETFRDLWQQALDCFDEPFADASSIPCFLLARKAKQLGIKVVINGDGADELFGGYSKYLYSRRLRCLRYLKAMFGAQSTLLSAKLVGALASAGDSRVSLTKFMKTLQFIELDNASSIAELYAVSSTNLGYSHSLVDYLAGASGSHSGLTQRQISAAAESRALEKGLMLLDQKIFLPGDILVKTDRTTMAMGIESRSPFLSAQLSILANRLPQELLLSRSTGKLILRKILSESIPSSLIDGGKKGFSIPINDWVSRLGRLGIVGEKEFVLLNQFLGDNNLPKQKNLVASPWYQVCLYSWLKSVKYL